MNRHHPYASGYDGPPRRGGGGPSAGPDRSYRGAAPRGRGRGRGGMYGGGPESPGPTPYGLPPPPENGYYGSYDNQAPQQDYSGYGSAYQSAPAPMYGNPPPTNGYEQTYRGYEDTKPPGPPAPGQYNYSGYGPEPTHHRRDDRVPDSVINERLSREKPCRTLFVRNIRYETASDEVRRIFEEHGEVKTFFDLIANRGMVFVTYYDLRAAERARDRLQGSEIAGRAIDVHYSLPKDDAGSKNLEMQGTILVTLQNSRTNQPLDDYELRAVMQTIGDIKSIQPVDNRHDQRYVELYDLRACDMAVDRLRQRPFQDGTLDLILAWNDDDAQSGPPRGGGPRRGGGGGGRDFDDGPRGRRRRRGGGRGRYGGDGPGHDEYDRGGDWDGDRGRPSYNDQYGPPRPGPDRDYDRYGGPPSLARHGGPPPPPMSAVGSSESYGAPPPQHYGNAPGPGGGDDRLDKAKKVQQLLEALKQPTSAGATPQHYPAIGGPSYYGHAAPPPPPSYTGNYQQPSYGGPPSGPPADPRTYGGDSYGGGQPPPPPGQPEPGQPSYEQLRNIFQNQAAAAGRR